MLTHLKFPWLILICSLLTFACTDDSPAPVENTDGGTATPYVVSGKVVDTQGRPLAGVKVRADNDALYGSAEVTTDANGNYTLPKLEIGGWKIYAWHDVEYKGHTYHLRMGMPTPADYDAFSPGEAGAVKNFKWQLSGQIPDRPRGERTSTGYFGGALRFTNMDVDAVSMPVGTVVTITLTPVAGATLFDGSAPQTIQKSFTIQQANEYNYWIHDIPQSEYRITAQSSKDGVVKTIYMSESIYDGYRDVIEGFYFKPALGSAGTYENGLLGPEDNTYYMQLR